MRQTKLSEAVQARIPAQLAEALSREADRRMMSEAAIIRQALARELGLLEPSPQPRQAPAGQQPELVRR